MLLVRVLDQLEGKMKSAKIISGAYENCFNSAEGMVDDEGTINWGIAFRADPGVAKCPSCEEFYWREGVELQCECGAIWNTRTKELVK